MAFLASEGCELSGEVWSVGGGSVSRFFTGLTDGYFKHPLNEGELTIEDVYSDFLDSFARALDPHSNYLPQEVFEDFRIGMELSLEGIGALLGRENEYTQISRVVPGGPVAKDGRVYILTDRGAIHCLDLKSGKEVWQQPMERACAARETG